MLLTRPTPKVLHPCYYTCCQSYLYVYDAFKSVRQLTLINLSTTVLKPRTKWLPTNKINHKIPSCEPEICYGIAITDNIQMTRFFVPQWLHCLFSTTILQLFNSTRKNSNFHVLFLNNLPQFWWRHTSWHWS